MAPASGAQHSDDIPYLGGESVKKDGKGFVEILKQLEEGEIDRGKVKALLATELINRKKDKADIQALIDLGTIMRQSLWPYKEYVIKYEIGHHHAPPIIEAWDNVIARLGGSR